MRRTSLLWLLAAAPPALAQSQPLNLANELAHGGTGIWVIAALSVLAVAVTLERLTRLRASRLAPSGLVDAVLPLWKAGDMAGVQAQLSQRPSALARVLAYLVQHRRADTAALSTRAGDIASLALREQQQRAYPLAVVATIAPIVGLLGTVVGMIEAFHAIAFAGGLGDPAVLASGISKALVNTAAGLSVALPALGMHHFFKHRLTLIGLALEREVNRVFDEVLIQPEAARDAH
ncbi:MotA/TolQ/ExbB proton channel family protein [Roseateles sp. P5_E7]